MKVSVDLVPSRTLRAAPFPYLFQLAEAAHVPWPMAPSSISKANRVAHLRISWTLTFLSPYFTYKNSCDYLEPLPIIQSNSSILSLIMSAESHLPHKVPC